MRLSINNELRRIFELATLRREARTIIAPQRWADVTALRLRCDATRTREKDLYSERYQTRVGVRRRKLIDEAGAARREFQPWGVGRDRFDPQATRRQAERDVRIAHEARMMRIDEFECRQLGKIVERARKENALRTNAREIFESGPDRPAGIDRHRSRDR